jgi:outer membrane lipoprotein LolB
MRRLTILATCLILSACAQLKPPPPAGTSDAIVARWASHIKQVKNIKQWTINGRIGSRTAYRASSASIQWQQEAEHFKIHLSGPLGQGALSAQGTSDFIEIHSATTGKISSNNPQQLLNQELGWVFPLSQAKNWVIGNPGKPRNQLEKYTLDPYGRMEQFIDNGWQINYHNYRETGNIALPHKIVLKYLDTKIIVIVKNWTI